MSIADISMLQSVKNVFDSAGVPAEVWYPIMVAESGGNPAAIGDNGQSIGLFQLNLSGQGSGFDPTMLQNPILNAQIAARAIAPAFQAVKNQFPQSVWARETALRSGHPLGSPGQPSTNPQAIADANRIQRIQDAMSTGTQIAQTAFGRALGLNQSQMQGAQSAGDALANLNKLAGQISSGLQKFDFTGFGVYMLGLLLVIIALILAAMETDAGKATARAAVTAAKAAAA